MGKLTVTQQRGVVEVLIDHRCLEFEGVSRDPHNKATFRLRIPGGRYFIRVFDARRDRLEEYCRYAEMRQEAQRKLDRLLVAKQTLEETTSSAVPDGLAREIVAVQATIVPSRLDGRALLVSREVGSRMEFYLNATDDADAIPSPFWVLTGPTSLGRAVVASEPSWFYKLDAPDGEAAFVVVGAVERRVGSREQESLTRSAGSASYSSPDRCSDERTGDHDARVRWRGHQVSDDDVPTETQARCDPL